ncbi:MAG: branched-chain amino acid ABC transporter permease, partial [Coxiellaceae bacterium]|nr:branched-chain amino acid ABC transporter permease [Coxiellaceae bacterium]
MTVKKGLLVLAILAGLIYPFVSTQHYQLHQFSMVFAYVILLLGLNVLVGKSGQISMGHTAFYAIGAYTTTLMMTRLHTGFYITIVPSVALCFIAGILFGLPVQGLSFIYLMLATLALGVSIPQLLKRFSEFTGGVGGIVVPEPTIPSFIPVAMDVWMYLLCFIAMLFVLWITWNLMRGYIGRAMMAIRDNSVAAAAMGVNVAYYKTM